MLVECPVNENHHYFDHLKTCPWCERESKLGIYSFPSQYGIQTKLTKKPKAKKAPQPVTYSPPKIPRYVTLDVDDIIIMSEKITILVGIVFGAFLSQFPINLSADWTIFAYSILFISSLGFGLTNMYRAKYWPDTMEAIKRGALAGLAIIILIFLLALTVYRMYDESLARAILNTSFAFPFLYITTLTSMILRGSLDRSLLQSTHKTSGMLLALKPLIPLVFIIAIGSFAAFHYRASPPVAKKTEPLPETIKSEPTIKPTEKVKQIISSTPYIEKFSIGTLSGEHNQRFTEKNIFYKGDSLDVITDIRNINHNGKIRLFFKFLILRPNFETVAEYIDVYNNESKVNKNVKCYDNKCIASIKLHIGDKLQPGKYDIYIHITDKVVNKLLIKYSRFFVKPKSNIKNSITKLLSEPLKPGQIAFGDYKPGELGEIAFVVHNSRIDDQFVLRVRNPHDQEILFHKFGTNLRKHPKNILCKGENCIISFEFQINKSWLPGYYSAYIQFWDPKDPHLGDMIGVDFKVMKRTKVYGFLRVNTKPTQLLVGIRSQYSRKNDTQTCLSPCKIELGAGKYIVTTYALGYEDLTQEVTVKANKTTKIHLELKKMRTVGGN